MKDVDPEPFAPPTVSPVGITQYPEGYTATPRAYGARMRGLAGALLVIFALVVVVSTGVSLGSYCLTSDGADWSDLRPWLDPSVRSGTERPVR